MKRIFITLLAVMVLLASASLAEDFSSMSDDELIGLYIRVSDELRNRNISGWKVTDDGIRTAGAADREIGGCLEAFLSSWHDNDLDGMLAQCAAAWKEKRENPKMDLFAILANRTPIEYELSMLYGNPGDTVRTASVKCLIDRHNGKEPNLYLLEIIMNRDSDGLWYVDPESLLSYEDARYAREPEATPEPAEEEPEVTGDTVLYYCPQGGEYYHLERYCPRVNEKYLPLQGMFTYAQLDDEAFRDLQPCSICGAPARQETPRHVTVSFREAVDSADENSTVTADMDYLCGTLVEDGKYVRKVTLLDTRAKELYMSAVNAEDNGEALEAFDRYAWSLPVTYTEEITAVPKEQAELDALSGKTIGEIVKEGYFLYGSGGGEGIPVTVDLTYGMFNYVFEADADFDEYQKHLDADDLDSLAVKNGKLEGLSCLASGLEYLADGTYRPEVVPNITADEAAAAAVCPPAEEYTVKAWPLDSESYAELLGNIEGRYGQVYMVKGVVHQVLSTDPVTLVINTSEDGSSRPVIVELSEQLSSLFIQEGMACRIYADVSSSRFILPVLTGRYSFTE